MKHFSAPLLLVLGLVTGIAGAASPIEINNAWVREAPPGSTVMASYMVLKNPANTAQVLTGISSDCCKAVEIHTSYVEDGRARMERLDKLTIPAGGQTELAPGGMHIMLFDPAKRLVEGNCVMFTLHFADSSTLEIHAPVIRKTGNDEHAHHSH